MNRLNLFVIVLLFAAVLYAGCNKPDDGDRKVDVYVAGWENNAKGVSVAVLWKNGTPQYLTDGTVEAWATAVFVSGDDEYVVGESPSNTVVLWKNGELQYLTDGEKAFSSAGSVFVSGNDVYVAGFDGQRAVLWKNGVAQYLTDGLIDSFASSVFISGNDVYVSGCDRYSGLSIDGTLSGDGTLWKNGVAQKLNDCPFRITIASSVFVVGNDVYVAGHAFNSADEYEKNLSVAKLWKNGMEQTLSEGYAFASSVYVSGSDVYVALTERRVSSNNVAKLWKNGNIQNLTNETNWSEVGSVFVAGNDVYVSGAELTGTNWVPKLWKNGVAQSLTNGTNRAGCSSVFVKMK